MLIRTILGFTASAVFSLVFFPVHADDSIFWDAMAQPGVHAIMRHALAPGGGDPANFALDDCSTQRNLNDAGREQARATGAAFQDNDITIDRVLTSQWCRCRETAELLGLGEPEDYPPLNSFFAERRHLGPEQTRELREYLTTVPNDQKLMLVTHFVNISGLLSEGVTSGEVVAFRIDDEGNTEVLETLVIPAR